MLRYLITLIGLCTTLVAAAQDVAVGHWLTEKGESVVEITRAANNTYTGRVVWLRTTRDANGEDLRDVLNNNPKLRSRRVVGMEVLSDYKWDEGVYRHGNIYNYNNGNSYNSKMYIEGGKLYVKGYYSLLFFLGRTKEWTRVTDLTRYGLK